MKYGTGKGRFEAAGGSGVVFTGKVVIDPKRMRPVLVDSDGSAYDVIDDLKALVGKEARVTVISTESIALIERALESATPRQPDLPEGHTPVVTGNPRLRR